MSDTTTRTPLEQLAADKLTVLLDGHVTCEEIRPLVSQIIDICQPLFGLEIGESVTADLTDHLGDLLGSFQEALLQGFAMHAPELLIGGDS